MLPDGWVRSTVGELFDIKLGKMLNKLAKEESPQFPYLANYNVQWGKFELDELNTMYFSEDQRKKFTLVSGDILLCEGGEVGRCAIWNEQLSNCFYQKALHRLRSKGNILPVFFQSYMELISGTKLLDDFTTRTSIAHLTKEKLTKLPVNVPELQEQKKIRRQQGIGTYIVDFYCAEFGLIIEIDGDSHYTEDAKKYDDERTAFLQLKGFRVVRFTNLDVMQNKGGVLQMVATCLEQQLRDAGK